MEKVIRWLSKAFSFRRALRRRRKTLIIAANIAELIGDKGIVVMSEDQFFDINQVKEVIDVLAKNDGVSIRANVFHSQVIFHAENIWNRY